MKRCFFSHITIRNTFLQTLTTITLLSSCLLMVSGTARADGTWIPSFNPKVHVYVDPKLAKDPNYPVRLQDLDQQLVQGHEPSANP